MASLSQTNLYQREIFAKNCTIANALRKRKASTSQSRTLEDFWKERPVILTPPFQCEKLDGFSAVPDTLTWDIYVVVSATNRRCHEKIRSVRAVV